jgi:hypothetical protein
LGYIAKHSPRKHTEPRKVRIKMRVTKFNIVKETGKALQGKRAKVDVYTLFQVIATEYLQTVKAEKAEPTGEDPLPKFRPLSTHPRALQAITAARNFR